MSHDKCGSFGEKWNDFWHNRGQNTFISRWKDRKGTNPDTTPGDYKFCFRCLESLPTEITSADPGRILNMRPWGPSAGRKIFRTYFPDFKVKKENLITHFTIFLYILDKLNPFFVNPLGHLGSISRHWACKWSIMTSSSLVDQMIKL